MNILISRLKVIKINIEVWETFWKLSAEMFVAIRKCLSLDVYTAKPNKPNSESIIARMESIPVLIVNNM